ncbi:hypothetical protein DF185_09350 [Marinifilum breve]|uniref:Uncharacterized protein n=1 Tax=Marinifilum breve TaxID=2184082 RepID=A0A2V3ZZE5_9BACT|nr:hypothetical protein DF185_09350 [Marinifilum breve]
MIFILVISACDGHKAPLLFLFRFSFFYLFLKIRNAREAVQNHCHSDPEGSGEESVYLIIRCFTLFNMTLHELNLLFGQPLCYSEFLPKARAALPDISQKQ